MRTAFLVVLFAMVASTAVARGAWVEVEQSGTNIAYKLNGKPVDLAGVKAFMTRSVMACRKISPKMEPSPPDVLTSGSTTTTAILSVFRCLRRAGLHSCRLVLTTGPAEKEWMLSTDVDLDRVFQPKANWRESYPSHGLSSTRR